ncbi:MAG TPA: SDR family oxidoreductase [Patescibacteria group bacterium]|nr:SDR family oxidoreductase [Patescibacteria group bacterium]
MGNLPTALITGASGGIGLELARVFAKNNINVALTARSENKLKELKRELENNYGIKVTIIALDLSDYNNSLHIYQYLKTEGVQIHYLVNNAGFGDYGFFHESDWTKQEEMINLNVTALTYLTHLFLKDMVARKSGKVMNVSSTAAFQPGPLMSVYYATKAFVQHFSEAIANELKDSGVTVTALCPGPTESNFQQAAEMGDSPLFKRKLPTSAEVAEYGFKAMMAGKTVAIHGVGNKILRQSGRFAPRKVLAAVVRKIQEAR